MNYPSMGVPNGQLAPFFHQAASTALGVDALRNSCTQSTAGGISAIPSALSDFRQSGWLMGKFGVYVLHNLSTIHRFNFLLDYHFG